MRELFYFLFRTMRNIREEWALNLRIVTGFALMLVVLGVFAMLSRNLEVLLTRWGEELQITAYLDPALEESERVKMAELIEKLPEVERTTYTSEALAMRRFRQDLGGLSGILDGLEGNPLPPSIEVRVPPEHRTAGEIAELAKQVGLMEGVRDVQYGQEWVERYRIFLELVSALGAGLAVILIFVGWSSISNLIMLTVYARKDEIEILKLVGATDRFVRTPFLLEGLVQGLVASLLALGLLYALHASVFVHFARSLTGFFGAFEPVFLGSTQIALLVGGSLALGLVASFVATGRHLEV